MSETAEIKTESQDASEKIVFKKKVRKNLRQRRQSLEETEEKTEATEQLSALEDIKEKQRLRQRPNGVSVAGLAIGKKLAVEEEITIKDPYNVKTGGLVNMTTLKSGKVKEVEDAYDVGIGTQFSAETNKRDEDEEMMKYIEQELQKRKGNADQSEEGADVDPKKYLTPEEAALFSLPDHLRQSTSHRSEEMLSNQMLNGIPEVDLGIDAKIKNIEATEEAKQKLLQDQKNKKDGPSQFVPTNMAVNFMQHNRFKIEDNSEPRRRKREQTAPAGAGKNGEGNGVQKQQQHQQPHHHHQNNQHPNHQVGPNGVKRATDDYHYDKFKKQFRRY